MPDKKQKENQVKTIFINDVEYNIDDLTENQMILVNHVADLDRKLAGANFNLDQLKGGREYFMSKLEHELEEDEKVTIND